MLPPIKKVKMPTLTLPTPWQTVIFRNYGYVRTERIASVLGCDNATVAREAERLGVPDRGYAEKFEARGYITVIRNNWFLLPYGQLMTLLGMNEARLDFVLEKEDFLSVKLGNYKPECPEVTYAPLTEEQRSATEDFATMITPYMTVPERHPFEFFTDESDKPEKRTKKGGRRIVHGYLSPCGDAFASDCTDTLPDGLLEKYRDAGVDGIWLHAVLSSLSPYPFLPTLSEGYEERRANMNKIIERCKKYGISLYLYMNEPRALPVGVAPEYEELIGWRERRTLCMEREEVVSYLYDAVRDLCSAVPDLGGIFTITMSENPTHCNFTNGTACPVCKDIPAYKSAARVNNVILRAMKDAGCHGELIANLWGWSPYLLWSEEEIRKGIELLDREISVLCVSEYDLEIEKGGVKSRVIDYSISNPGPSEITKKTLLWARETGHKVYAKIQASNSWECAAAPYLPVFDLVHEHLRNLAECGVEDLFLTWTQGGYPSPSVSLAAAYGAGFDLDEWYETRYGEQAAGVHEAVGRLGEAFREYPFSVRVLYLSPHTLGSANLWELELEEKLSSMVCFAYDDYLNWCAPYPSVVYIGQMERLLRGWQRGLCMLSHLEKTPAVEELSRYAEVAFCHFRADYYQTKFAVLKREDDKDGMLYCVTEERKNAERLLRLMREDAKIGYEASNHYFYTERNLIEKIARMEAFEKLLRQ